MIFKALPVKCGDSFYLECEGKTILVDGGKNKLDILKILKKEKIQNHIDLLVCTHYDADHINGIIEILQSNNFSFNEIWLPEIFGSIIYTLANSTWEVLNYLRHADNIDFNLERISYDAVEVTEGNIDDSYELIDNENLSYLNEFHSFEFNHLFFHGYKNVNEHYFKMIINLGKISNLIHYSINSGAYIRWFSFQNNINCKSYGFDMYSINGLQTKITKFTPDVFLKALYLTTINKESLVYLFKKENFPNILFTADSDLSSCKTFSLKDYSIITAPHHGSGENDIAYAKITGKKLVFVRSDNSQIKRPGLGYLGQSLRYCTICRNLGPKQTVTLELINGTFSTTAMECKC